METCGAASSHLESQRTEDVAYPHVGMSGETGLESRPGDLLRVGHVLDPAGSEDLGGQVGLGRGRGGLDTSCQRQGETGVLV